MESHILTVSDDWDYETSWSWYSSGDINKISVNHVSAIDSGINNWLFLKGLNWCFHESWHKTQFNTMLFGKSLLSFVASIHKCWHIDFIESSETSISVLRFLKTACNSLSHFIHGNASFYACSWNFWGSFLASNSSSGVWWSWYWCWNWSWLSRGSFRNWRVYFLSRCRFGGLLICYNNNFVGYIPLV